MNETELSQTTEKLLWLLNATLSMKGESND
jgi:hypothetical protein